MLTQKISEENVTFSFGKFEKNLRFSNSGKVSERNLSGSRAVGSENAALAVL